MTSRREGVEAFRPDGRRKGVRTSMQPPETSRAAGDGVARAQAGDRAAFTALVQRHDHRLRGLAYKLLAGDRHRMDDAMQEAYLNAYRGLGRFRSDADVGTWLYRIVYNACVDELRRGRRRPEPVDPAGHEAAIARSGPATQVAAADAALRGLRALPDDQRVTVVLVDGEGFDNVQAAEILGVAPGTVASRLSRARAAMRAALHDPTDDDETEEQR
jgi:RNA polymerase sigma-70 factor, ECF subfamily